MLARSVFPWLSASPPQPRLLQLSRLVNLAPGRRGIMRLGVGVTDQFVDFMSGDVGDSVCTIGAAFKRFEGEGR